MSALAVDLDASPSSPPALPASLLPPALLPPARLASSALPAPPLARPAPPPPPPAPRPVEDSLERYVRAAMDLAQRTALARVRSLREPRRAGDADAALRTVEQLVESLTGYIVGCAVLPMAQRLRQAGGPEVRAAVQEVLHAMAGAAGPAALPAHDAVAYSPRFLADADARPLVDELGRRLCTRLMLASGDVRALLRQLITAAERAHPGGASTLAVAIHAALDDLRWITERVGPAVTEAWDHAAALLRQQPRRAPEAGAWVQWTRRAAGLPEPTAELTATQVVAAGFVMRIG